jgi:hypothetical protein
MREVLTMYVVYEASGGSDYLVAEGNLPPSYRRSSAKSFGRRHYYLLIL